MSSWSEIQKLAADLQRIQLGDVAKKLSERNCVEIVFKLAELGLVDLVYSIDGKEYITRQYLVTQIKNECYGNKGRVSLVDLQQVLNVEYQQVEAQVQEIIKTDPSFIVSVGQLISREYLENVCCEINSQLLEEGHLTISQITKSYDLPSELLQNEVYSSLGKTIQGFADKDDRSFLYTEDYVKKQKALLRGALSGLTKITPVSHILSHLKLQPSLFFQLLDELLSKEDVKGQITGGRHVDRAVFVPHLYTDLVCCYAQDFYRQNGYMELRSLKKLGITDPSSYLKDVLTEEEVKTVVLLSSCALSGQYWTGIVASVEEALEKQGWVDICAQLPSEIVTEENIRHACSLLQKDQKDLLCCEETFLYKASVLSDSIKLLDAKILEEAEKATPEVMKLLKSEKKENLSNASDDSKGKKRGGGKKGGGKKRQGKDEEKEDLAVNDVKLEFMNAEQLLKCLYKEEGFSSCPEPVLREVADKIRPELNQKYRTALESVFMSSQADAASKMKRSHAEFQEQMKAVYQNICMFDSGAEFFEETVADQLRGYLLKTVCTDAANLTLAYVMGITETMTQKVTDKAIKELNVGSAAAFKKLFGTLTAKSGSLEDFYAALEEVSGPDICSLNLKPPDKKTRARLLTIHKAELELQLSQCEEPASGLLLVLMLLISYYFECAVHASGKFVPNLASLVQPKVENELALLIAETQALVVKSLKSGSKKGKVESESAVEGANEKFRELKEKVIACISE